MIYHAYSIAQDIKMLNEWKNTPGLKRKVKKELRKQADKSLAVWTKGLPPGTDFSRHWSGKRSLQEAVRSLRGVVLYSTLYRFTSSMAHASDFGAHCEIDEVSGDPIWQIEGGVRGFNAPSYAARELLWHAAARIDQRLGLGFSTSLAPHKLVKQPKRL